VKESARKVLATSNARPDSNAATSAARNPPAKPLASAAEDLKRQNAALEKENRELRHFIQYRSSFLTRLAHELRTPLTSILGFAEILLSQEKLTELQRNFCERIQNSALQLQSNLNQLADLSRLDAGRSELVIQEFSLDELLREVCAVVERQFHKQEVELRRRAAPGLPLISCDREKLRQVIYHLLSHAISRSPRDSFVKARIDRNARGFLLKIEDEGEPLAEPEGIGTLDPESRLPDSSQLGVAIARRNIELLGAKLSARNRQPHGLEVKIQLPPCPVMPPD